MAKTLDKKHSLNQSKIIKLRRNLDFLGEEYKALDTKFDEKIEKELNAFLKKGNKSLEKLAFQACDKEAYAQSILDEKLQKYDVKMYMKQREINHGAAKKIFKQIKAKKAFGFILVERDKKMSALNKKREKFIASLEKDKAKFISKQTVTYVTPFNLRRSELEKEYYLLEESLKKKYGKIIAKEKMVLSQKIKAVEEDIAKLKAKSSEDRILPDDVLLEVKGLKMYFGGLKAVDDLTFNVKKGEIFGLIGPNGAGKTTVFNCITRFYDATDGEMYFENKYGEVVDLRQFKVHDIILQGIGRTFQNIELVKEVSVIENLLVASTRSYKTGFFGHLLGFPSLKKEEKLLRAKAMRILKFMGLENYAQWYAMGLPYGILKKVEIARALMADAKLIIMDEPAAGLNDRETAELTETIRKIRDEFGVTILLVEHDMGLVMSVCDTVCAISFGQMLAIGTTEEIQKDKAVQEAYLGASEEE